MHKTLAAIIISLAMPLLSFGEGSEVRLPSEAQVPRSDSTWRAVGELVATQAVTHLLGRYVMNEPFSQTSIKSIRHNLSSNFAWDDDNFYVNYAGHGYQGSLMFNAARSNGFSFWQSVPFTFAGSLLWEYFGETEQPSINDMLTTTFVGSFMGEMTHRLSREIVDERTTGFARFLREAAVAIINPVEGFHRILNGRAWKISSPLSPQTSDFSHQSSTVSLHTSLSLGARYLSLLGGPGEARGSLQPYLSLALQYGEAADGESHSSPFDFFSVDGALAFGKKQHLLSHFYMTGRIASTSLFDSNQAVGELGLYQHFVYEDTHLPESSDLTPQTSDLRHLTSHITHHPSPFPFGEMVSLGPGLQFTSPSEARGARWAFRLYAKGIALGAVESDHYRFYNRNYNMGSGYGVSSQGCLACDGVGALHMRAGYMHLYTWKGYEPRDLSELSFDNNYLNVLGDRSDAHLLSLSLQAHINITSHIQMTLGSSYYHRNTHYKYYPNCHSESYETRAGLMWSF